jgi:organic radical activating enzyme
MNQQPIEKLDTRQDGSLEVHSIFYTIQGEGPFTGQPAIFVRLAGCNLACPGCDTDYTSTRQRVSALALRDKVLELREEEYPNAPTPLIVITGGEPFRQNISAFANNMVVRGYLVQVETNGTLPVPEGLHRDVVIVCSPKTGRIQESVEKRMVALKYVVRAGCIDRADGLPIRALDNPCAPVVAKPPEGFRYPIYIQPFDEGVSLKNRANLNAAVNACKAYGHILQIQTHKIAGIE